MLAQMGTDKDGEEEYIIKNVAGTAFSGMLSHHVRDSIEELTFRRFQVERTR